MLTRALALELRERDITVNAVSLQVDRPCAPDQVADVIAYLLSDHGHRLTGQVLRPAIPDCSYRFRARAPETQDAPWTSARTSVRTGSTSPVNHDSERKTKDGSNRRPRSEEA